MPDYYYGTYVRCQGIQLARGRGKDTHPATRRSRAIADGFMM